MRRTAVLALALLACGDNDPLGDGLALAPAAELVVVAHQDDDLLFMQPDLLEAIQRGDGVTTVFVTAGNGLKGNDRADRRYEGSKSAYGAAAGSTDWLCGFIAVAGHDVQHCRLADRNVSLVFLGYPDGGKYGEYATSLLRLWQGEVASVETIAHDTTSYDRDGLIDTLAQIVRETQPVRVRTLEVAATHGRDHSDHMISGALSLLAVARAHHYADVLSYRGYEIENEPENQLGPVYDASAHVLAHYEACVTGCAACGEACTEVEGPHATWLHRRYAIGYRRAASGQLRHGTECLASDGTLGSCAAAPIWRLDGAGQLRNGEQCLAIGVTGDVIVSACLGGRERRFFADDEGHLWSGMPPTAEADLSYLHLWCLSPADGGVRAMPCGADHAPAWDFVPPTVTTARSGLGFTATGRDVRLGDVTGDRKADLCAIESGGGLWCLPGNGTGGFDTVTRIDNTAMPLAVEPRSLVLGDVDGDGATDACGRDSMGLLCATAAEQYRAVRWSPSFRDGVAEASTAASLSAVDADADGKADICGIDMTGVVCAPRGLMVQPVVRSAWPEPASIVFPAELDGDGRADWCVATEAGPACGVDAQAALTTDGAPWGYAFGAAIDVLPANTATVAFGDIDGDGRADVCSPREDRIVCARSQGRAFGPRATTLAILPGQSTASALWLGDLDGDGRADPCADTGTSIVCAVSP